MSDEQRYGEEKRDDLPLPDADAAWQKMAALLDEDDRRRAVPWWFWRAAGGVLLMMGFTFAGWWWSHSNNKEVSREAAVVTTEPQQKATKRSRPAPLNSDKKKATESNATARQSAYPVEKNVADLVTPTSSQLGPLKAQKKRQAGTGTASAAGRHMPLHQRRQKPVQSAAPFVAPAKNPNAARAADAGPVKEKDAAAVLPTVPGGQDPAQQKALPEKNSTAAKDSVRAAPPPVAKAEEKTRPLKKKASFVVSAGIGLQQAIAVQHQAALPVDSGGRKKPFFDYYPSVYVKVQHGQWFAQAEAQYGVPQPVAGFSFSQKTAYDATAAVLQTERINVRKLYYHQLPVSINYLLLPQWSVGAGGVYNIFAGAVTEREVRSKYALTGAESVSKNTEPVKGYRDSFFYKTTAGLLLQSDYHWKRFSLGLRYTQNLQPFIKYTAPNGDVLDKKNNALQAVLRFRLWSAK